MTDWRYILQEVKGTCLVYVSDDGFYMREEEVIEQRGGKHFVIVQFQETIHYLTPDRGVSFEPTKLRQYEARRLPIPGPVPTGPAGDRVVSELLGRELRHWKRGRK